MISRKRYPYSLYFLTVKYSHNYVIQLHSGFSMSKRFWLLLLQVDFPNLMGTEPFSKATIIYLCRKYHCCVFLCKPPVTTVGSCGPLPWLCGHSTKRLWRVLPPWWRLAVPYTFYWIKSWGSVCGCSFPRPPPQAAAHLWASESFSPHFSQAAHISAMFPPRKEFSVPLALHFRP